jgi:hypothetical protein
MPLSLVWSGNEYYSLSLHNHFNSSPLYNNMANNRILALCNIDILFEKALEIA